jgi:iron(III) transport system permease protein
LVTLVLTIIAPLAAGRLAADSRSWSLVENTLFLVIGTVAISLPLGTALGVALFRTDVPFRRAAIVLVGLLLVVPLYVQATAWQAGFGASGWFTLLSGSPYQTGLLEGWAGAIWVHAMAATSWAAIIVGGALWFAEPELEELALVDGSAWQTLAHVTLRRALPAIGLAALWTAVTVATEMTVTDLFQTGATRLRTFAEEIYTQYALATEPAPPPTALVGAVLTGCLTLLAANLFLSAANWRPHPTDRPPLVFRLGRGGAAAGTIVLASILLMVGVPFANLVYKAGVVVTSVGNDFIRRWSPAKCWELVAAVPERYGREMMWSLMAGSLAASIALVVAVLFGLVARRGGAWGLPAILIAVAALATPGPLVSLALIAVFNNPSLPPLTELYDRSIVVLSLAQAVRAFPLAMVIMWYALRSVPRELLDAAALDGADAIVRFWRIIFPLRRPAFALAWLAAFVLAVSDSSSTMVAPPGVETLPARVAQMLHFNIQNELAGLCLFLMLSAAIVALLAFVLARVAGRRTGRGSSAADRL